MKPAAEKMKEKLQNINFEKPLKNIVSNVTARSENEPENIKNLLIQQIFSTVNWRESILNIHKEKVVNFVEIGPGKVLSGMVKRTIKTANCFSINSIADIENLKMNLKNKKILITGATGGIGNSLVKKFNDLELKIVATGTNEQKLEKLKKNFENIHTEKFRLDEHGKIEEFIDKVEKN